MGQKVCVIGLDCAAPELVFDLWQDILPNLRRLMQRGIYGPLESVTPPITVPAWMCMMTGKDPGTLGIYGFRNRRDRSYEGLTFANNRQVKEPALWDVLAEYGLQTIALGVPLTYPPRPINGLLVSDFLAPGINGDYTYPPELKDEIRTVVGEYMLDAPDFRTEDKDRLLADIYTMTERRFALARHLITAKPWDLFVMVEMGPDRMHHAFWRYFDSLHPLYTPGNPYEHAIRDYYVALDGEIGRLIALLEPDTRLLVVSDHGAKRMVGGLCFNEWLLRAGYLVLKTPPTGITKFAPELVDWSRTRAWGDGGYYGRLFLNVRGREPHGTVAPDEVATLKAELTAKLEQMTDEHGKPLGNRIFAPETIYAACHNVAPDLIVYFGDLHWRSVGSLGHETIWTHTNDTGPDDANHAQQGILLMARASDVTVSAAPDPAPHSDANRREGLSLYDVAPTVLRAFGIAPPPGMGRAAIDAAPVARQDSAYSAEEEEELARRLEDLGYL
jgi:predicted AlkP superfamily phosphohydrolase/phosphomutase